MTPALSNATLCTQNSKPIKNKCVFIFDEVFDDTPGGAVSVYTDEPSDVTGSHLLPGFFKHTLAYNTRLLLFIFLKQKVTLIYSLNISIQRTPGRFHKAFGTEDVSLHTYWDENNRIVTKNRICCIRHDWNQRDNIGVTYVTGIRVRLPAVCSLFCWHERQKVHLISNLESDH